MPGMIVFSAQFLAHQGESQVNGKPFPQGMTFKLSNLVDCLVAAGKVDQRIGAAVGTEPSVFDVGTPFSTCVMEQKGFLRLPMAGEHNKDYWQESARMNAAAKVQPSDWLEVVDGVHVSLSCTDPHLSVIILAPGRKQRGTKIHICVKPAGDAWEFDKVHGGTV